MQKRQSKFEIVICVLLACAFSSFIGCRKTTVPINGSSMAPRWVGEHRECLCDGCNFMFRFDSANAPHSRQIICPNCGLKNGWDQTRDGRSSHVKIVGKEKLERWDVVAFNNANTEAASVKRIVGLPGEKIEFKGCNLYANGELVRKSISEQLDLAIPVFFVSDLFLLRGGRLNPENIGNGWKFVVGKLMFFSDEFFTEKSSPDDIEWMVYDHRICYRHKDIGLPNAVIDDHYGFNQNLARQTHPTWDILAEIHVRNETCPELFVRMHDGVAAHEISIDLGGIRGDSLIRISTIDDQLLVFVDGRPLRQDVFDYAGQEKQAQPRNFAIGCRQGKIHVDSIRIWRDLYYFVDSSQTSWQLEDDEYFVIGDNVPVSRDSRHWPGFGVKRDTILGTVK